MSVESGSQVPPSSIDVAAPALPATPRPLTRRARRRSWAELPVRPWIILTIATSVVCLYFLVTRVQEAVKDRWLIENGTDVVAKFTNVNNDPVPKRYLRTEAMAAVATFDWHGKPFQLEISRLEAKLGAHATVGEPFPIKVDPNDPSRWTEETVPKPWLHELTAVGVLLPLAGIAFGVMLLQRRAMLQTWVHAPMVAATVIEARQSGGAPLSRIVRFTLNNQSDRRIWTVLIPVSAGIPNVGETLWLICPPQNPKRSILARLYHDG